MHVFRPVTTFCVIIIIFFGGQLFAQANNNQFYLYEDSTKQLTGEKALQLFNEQKFTAVKSSEMNKGFTRSVFWLAYTNNYNSPIDSLLLFIGDHHINRIHFYYVNDNSAKQEWVTGDYYPFSQRPVNATGFYFPVNKKGVYLAQINKANESLQLSFKLVVKANALSAEADNKTIMALLTGMMMLMTVFGFYLFIVSKDKVYIFYILYIVSGWLWVLANAGYGFQYLWPNLPWFASKSRPVFAIVPLIFSLLFLPRYIGGIKSKKLQLFINTMIVFLLVCIIAIFLFNKNGYQKNWWLYIQYLIPLTSLLYVFMMLGILSVSAFKGNRLSMFYLAAILALLISIVLQASFAMGSLNGFGVFFSYHGLSVGIVIEAIILTSGLVYRFNQYRIDKEKLLLEMNKRQVENTRILMEVQEAERSQVANQLHDVAGSLLSAARLNLSSLLEKGLIVNDNAVTQLKKTEEAVSLVSDMVRNLSHALSPVMMEQVGFKTAMEKVIAIFNASGKIDIKLLVLGFEKYNPQLNNYYTALYSMIYELLNNIVKHSDAKHALLQVTEHEDAFTLIAEDDGIGFNHNKIEKKHSLGIAGIQSKINYFNGSIAFDKNMPQGLVVTIEIPISYDNK
ncbi:MAG: histidine kinase [Ferruginibacter sp.]|nr:histidine kinase [Ferruginibacter sp.]